MLILTCKCGHQMKVAADTIGRSRICQKCHERIAITKENARAAKPGMPPAAGMAGGSAQFTDKKRIGELLIAKDIISPGQLAEALEVQKLKGGKVVEVLIAQGHLSVQSFITFLAKQPGIASIDLAHYQIPSEIISLVPKEIAIKHEVFPIDKMGRLMTLGMACPLDSKTIEEIESNTGLRVKALLCGPEDIRAAIRRYYPHDKEDFGDLAAKPSLRTSKIGRKIPSAPATEAPDASKIESALKLSGVSRLVQELKSLPALPDTVERVRASMSDLSISPRDVAQTILKDPPVAAKVLSVANSAAYGFPSRVDTVELAVALLGLRETYTIVLSAAVLDMFAKTNNFDYSLYWEEAMNSAAAANIIARAIGRDKDKSLFTAGLLHDIGRIALLETVPELYSKIPPTLNGDELVEAEQAAVGLSHTEAGFELATNWNLPVEIAEPIRFHHSPQFATEKPVNVAIVALAEAWTRTLVLDGASQPEVLATSAELLKTLEMSETTATEVYQELAALERTRFEWSHGKTVA